MSGPVTRLGEGGYGVRRVGSFSGKTPDSGSGPHPVGIITRLGEGGYGVRRYSSFAGKTTSVAQENNNSWITRGQSFGRFSRHKGYSR